MPDNYKIHLNFLPAINGFPSFNVYRRPRNPNERSTEGERGFSLPLHQSGENYAPYWVRLDNAAGYELCRVNPHDNQHLTCWAIYLSILNQIRSKLKPEEFFGEFDRFLQEIAFVMRKHREGQELLVVCPYFLHETKTFGILVDFHFRLDKGVEFNHRVQQLSLSLNSAGKRNIDYYLDRTQKIATFINKRFDLLSPLSLPGSDYAVRFSDDFTPLPATCLQPKVYIFGGTKDSRSQFNGLLAHGPLMSVPVPPKLLFAFREQDRHAARLLAVALRGPKQRDRFGFPGFETLFKTRLEIDGNPVILPDLTEASFQKALQRVQVDREKDLGVLPVFVLPEGDENGYMDQKAIFTHAGVPTQVCTLPVIQDDYAIKWAIGNIALQIFCKAGGNPWKVRPTTERSLIVGISQSHKLIEVESKRHIERYFAFTVMTDNSGLFQRIEVLGESDTEMDYLSKLRRNLAHVLAQESANFNRVVVHTSFRLKHQEIDAIRKTVDEAAQTINQQCRFAVVKVNHRSRFFGGNRDVNSLVPFEATKVRLGAAQYLVWFEGIFPDNRTVKKLFPGPTHLEFLKCPGQSQINDDELLQDLVNLSGANWRGFNAKSAPVSVFYCHLIAELVHEFHARGLPLPKVQDLRPWFL